MYTRKRIRRCLCVGAEEHTRTFQTRPPVVPAPHGAAEGSRHQHGRCVCTVVTVRAGPLREGPVEEPPNEATRRGGAASVLRHSAGCIGAPCLPRGARCARHGATKRRGLRPSARPAPACRHGTVSSRTARSLFHALAALSRNGCDRASGASNRKCATNRFGVTAVAAALAYVSDWRSGAWHYAAGAATYSHGAQRSLLQTGAAHAVASPRLPADRHVRRMRHHWSAPPRSAQRRPAWLGRVQATWTRSRSARGAGAARPIAPARRACSAPVRRPAVARALVGVTAQYV